MDKRIALVLMALGLSGMLYAGLTGLRGRSPEAGGQPAPAARFERFTGGGLDLSSLRGQVVILDFWATWCPPCVEEMPSLIKLESEYRGRGVTFVAASRDDPATWRADVGIFADKAGAALTSFAAYADEKTADVFRVDVLPTMLVIDRSGRVEAAYTGYASEGELRARVERAWRGH